MLMTKFFLLAIVFLGVNARIQSESEWESWDDDMFIMNNTNMNATPTLVSFPTNFVTGEESGSDRLIQKNIANLLMIFLGMMF